MRLLMATDGSPDAGAALASAARVFRRNDLAAELLYVIPPFHIAGPSPAAEALLVERALDQYRAQMEREAERIFSAALEALRGESLEARTRTDLGSPGDVILRWSEGYDVTVLGAHDRLGRSQTGVGPIGTQVIGRCQNSIVIGREAVPGAPKHILLCLDGSASSTAALQEMVARVRLEDARVTIMHVIELPWVRLGLDADWLSAASGEDAAGLDALMRGEADRIVGDAAGALREHGVSVDSVIREGLPELQILSEAEVGEYDLIVLGATGRSDLNQVSLGSVASRVAEFAPATVWVVRSSGAS